MQRKSLSRSAIRRNHVAYDHVVRTVSLPGYNTTRRRLLIASANCGKQPETEYSEELSSQVLFAFKIRDSDVTLSRL